MRCLVLAVALILLSACQILKPPPRPGDAAKASASTAQIKKASVDAALREVEQEKLEIPETPIVASRKEPSLHHWINYQLHIVSLPRNLREDLLHLLDKPGQKLDAYATLQLVVISLHYPPRRNLSQMLGLLNDLKTSPDLNEDSRRYANQLSLWILQLQHLETELMRLRQQLDTEKTSKQELEEKIRKLTHIEETLNQRQRDREP